MKLALVFSLLFSLVHSSIILFPVEEPSPSTEELDCKATLRHNQVRSCIFPFIFRNKRYSACSMDASPTPWCAVQVDASQRAVKAGRCSVELSHRQCFPRQFWAGATVYRENHQGEIPCQQDSDCPQLDAEILEKTLPVKSEKLEFDIRSDARTTTPSVVCSLLRGVCAIDDGRSRGSASSNNGTAVAGSSLALTFTTSTAGQGFLQGSSTARHGFLQGSVDVSAFAVNKNPIAFESRARCGDPSTCRRGSHCCSVVWAGTNTQFICPSSCV